MIRILAVQFRHVGGTSAVVTQFTANRTQVSSIYSELPTTSVHIAMQCDRSVGKIIQTVNDRQHKSHHRCDSTRRSRCVNTVLLSSLGNV